MDRTIAIAHGGHEYDCEIVWKSSTCVRFVEDRMKKCVLVDFWHVCLEFIRHGQTFMSAYGCAVLKMGKMAFRAMHPMGKCGKMRFCWCQWVGECVCATHRCTQRWKIDEYLIFATEQCSVVRTPSAKSFATSTFSVSIRHRRRRFVVESVRPTRACVFALVWIRRHRDYFIFIFCSVQFFYLPSIVCERVIVGVQSVVVVVRDASKRTDDKKKRSELGEKKIGLPYVHSTEFRFTQLSFCHRPSHARASTATRSHCACELCHRLSFIVCPRHLTAYSAELWFIRQKHSWNSTVVSHTCQKYVIKSKQNIASLPSHIPHFGEPKKKRKRKKKKKRPFFVLTFALCTVLPSVQSQLLLFFCREF